MVDDNDVNRYQLEVLLSGNGYQVVTACHGAEALELATSEPPDLVITDILMPVMDGYTLCRAWQEDDRLRDVPLVFYTATYTEERDRDLALGLGARDFVVKPEEPDVFVRRIRDIVSQEERRGGTPPVAGPSDDRPDLEESAYLRQYNQVLIHKLEDKLAQLEQTQRELERDIAERERAEQELAASEARYRHVVDLMPEGLWVIDAESRTTFANPTMAAMLGYTVREMMGRPLADFVAPEDVPLLAQRIEHRRRGAADQHDFSFLRRDGAAVWTAISTVPLLGDDGSYQGALGVVTDVTEQRQAQRDRERLATALERSPQAIVLCDEEGTIVYGNAASRSLRPGPEGSSLGRSLGALCDEVFGPEVGEAVLRATQTGGAWSGRCAAGGPERRQLDVMVSPMVDSDGQITGFTGIAQDVTEIESLEAQLHQAQKMESLGTLASGVAHDFNNLLMVIRGQAELLMQDLAPDHPHRAGLSDIARAGDRATELVRQLLAFSRKQVLQPALVDLNEAIEGLARMLQRLLPSDISLSVDLGGDLCPVLVDRTRLDQVLMNLVVNARDAMPSGGHLTIRTATAVLDGRGTVTGGALPAGRYATVSVVDTGHGVAPEIRDRIFEPFFSTKGDRGTGLGLATVYGIVRQSGGDITIASEVGVGTTMRVYLPEAEDGAAGAPAPREEPRRGESGSGHTVLVVEDEAGVRQFVSTVLRGTGYTVLEAGSRSEALALARSHGATVDLVLSDVVMPDGRGPALCDEIRDLLPRAAVLYMSGYLDDTVTGGSAYGLGHELLEKPFTTAALQAAVRRALNLEAAP